MQDLISIPSETEARLQGYNIDIEQLKVQLHALLVLQAAVASSGGRPNGVPEDLPVRFVEGCVVSEQDPRTQLHGEFALRATQVCGSRRAKLQWSLACHLQHAMRLV